MFTKTKPIMMSAMILAREYVYRLHYAIIDLGGHDEGGFRQYDGRYLDERIALICNHEIEIPLEERYEPLDYLSEKYINPLAYVEAIKLADPNVLNYLSV